jgi:WD40 repeat protein
MAAVALMGLLDPESVQSFFEEVLVRNDPSLNLIASALLADLECDELNPLLFFTTGDTVQYYALDPAPHHLLACEYARSGKRIRLAVCRAAGRYALHSVLAQILFGDSLRQDPASLMAEEWDILFKGLIEEKKWVTLRSLIFSAPLPQVVTALHAIRGSGWKPSGDDCCIWETVIETLPDSWMYSLPSISPDITIGPGRGLVTRHAFSSDGRLLATGSCDGSVQVWQIGNGVLTATFQTEEKTVKSIVFSVDNRFLICGEGSSRYTCRDAGSGAIIWEFRVSGSADGCSALSPDGSFFVVSRTTEQLAVISVCDGTLLRPLSMFQSPVTALMVSQDNAVVFAGCADGSLCTVSLTDGSKETLLKGRDDPVRTLGLSAKDETVTVIFDTAFPILVDRSGKVLKTYIGHSGRVTVAAIATDSSHLAVAGAGRILKIWNCNVSAPARSLPISTKRITSCVFTPDGSSLAIGYNNGTIRLIRAGDEGPEWEHRGHRKGITSLEISADGTLLFSTGWDRSVRLWDIKTGELERTLVSETGIVTGIALLDNGNVIVAGYSGGDVRFYRRDNGEIVRAFTRYSRTMRVVASNESGSILAFAGEDNTLWCWNSVDDSVKSCEGLTGPPHSLSFIPGEDILVSGGWDGKVRLWDMSKGTLLATLAGHTSTITSCAGSSDGLIIATGSNDRTLRIWSRVSRRGIRVIHDSRTEVGAVVFSPDGCHLVAAGSDEIIRVYTMPDGTRDFDIPGIPGAVTVLAFTDDGHLLVAGYDTGILVLISWIERKIIQTIHAHSGPVTGIGVVKGGRNVVTGGGDGFLRVWALPMATDLAGKTIEDIPIASGLECSTPPGKDREQWRFLRAVLSARFSNEIELCSHLMETGAFDIQIVG